MPHVAVVYHSLYGHSHVMAKAIEQGLQKHAAAGLTVSVHRIPETLPQEVLTKMHANPPQDHPLVTLDDLTKADAFVFGIPTRYGRAPAQWDTFFDQTGQLWASGALVGKLASVFTSTATQHGGQETTLASFMSNFVHHGIIFVPLGYTHPKIGQVDEVMGGGPWGAGTVTRSDGSRMPTDVEKEIAEHQGEYFGKVVLKHFS